VSGRFQRSDALFRRAARVIPRGIYGTRGPMLVVPGSYPLFAERGRGAYYWDADGNRYIDYLCGFGASILGYADATVDAAARAADRGGFGFNHPTAALVEV
jgi:glutamate-1-semialdehyde 2,1-aminomutase